MDTKMRYNMFKANPIEEVRIKIQRESFWEPLIEKHKMTRIDLEIQKAKEFHDLLDQKPIEKDFQTFDEFYEYHKEWISKFDKLNK